jgi:hypothetical protein
MVRPKAEASGSALSCVEVMDARDLNPKKQMYLSATVVCVGMEKGPPKRALLV